MAMETVDTLELEIRTRANDAASKVTELAASVSTFGKLVRRHLSNINSFAGALKQINDSLGKLSSANKVKIALKGIENAAKATEAAKGAVAKATPSSWVDRLPALIKPDKRGPSSGPGMKQYNPETGKFEPIPGMNSVRDWMVQLDSERAAAKEAATAVAEVKEEAKGMSTAVTEADTAMASVASEATDASASMGEAATATAEVATEAKEGSRAMALLRRAGEALKTGMNAIGETIKHSIVGQLLRVAKMRMLRAIVKEIAAGFKEGIDNLYQWSNALNGHFAGSMDTAASKLMLLKNSLATAIAPVIEALIPVLSQVVSWINSACNALSQFFALLSGQNSWTKATETVEEYAAAAKNTAKNAKEAKDATKDLLADWDELNVIQQENDNSGTGGTGGSGKKAVDYSKMFTEVGQFDGWIKDAADVVNRIVDKFGGLKNTLAAIAAAILTWKFSSEFVGLIGKLSALAGIATGIILEFNITTALTEKFLDTGNEGWLVLDVLQALVGGMLMSKLVAYATNGAVGYYIGIPLMIGVNVLARTVALLSDMDVDAVSKEALEANAVSALETGAAAAYLMYKGGIATKTSLLGGVAVAVATFSVLTGLKADVKAVGNGEITEDYIAGKAIEAVGLTLATSQVAKLAAPNVTAAQALGFGALTGAAAVFTTIGATVGIVATEMVAEEGKITDEIVVNDIISSVSTGLGVASGLKVVSGFAEWGLSWGVVGTAGAAAAVLTMGALVGLQACIEVEKNDEITEDTIKQDVISAVLTGLGAVLATGAAVMAGVASIPAGGLLIIGGAVALATFGVLIGVQAVLAMDKNKVEWGNRELTEAEVQDFVNNEIFDTNPQITISLLHTKLTDVDKARGNLEDSITSVLTDVNMIRLRLDIENSLTQLETDVFGKDGLIERFKTYAKTQVSLIETTFKFIEIRDATGKDVTEEVKADVTSGWKGLTDIMDGLGRDLTAALKTAYDDSLDDVTRDEAINTVAKLTQMMTDIAEAVAYGQRMARLKTAFDVQLSDLSEQSVTDIVDFYTAQKDALIEELEAANRETAEGTLTLAYTYLDLSNRQTDPKLKKEYKDKSDELMAAYELMIENAAKGAAEKAEQELEDSEALEKVREAVMSKISGKAGQEDVMEALWEAAGDSTNWGILTYKFVSSEFSKDVMDALIKAAFPDDYTTLQKLVDAGMLKYSDIISEEAIMGVAEALNLKQDTEEGKQLIGNLTSLLLGGDVTGSAKDAAKEVGKEAGTAAGEGFKDGFKDALEQKPIEVESGIVIETERPEPKGPALPRPLNELLASNGIDAAGRILHTEQSRNQSTLAYMLSTIFGFGSPSGGAEELIDMDDVDISVSDLVEEAFTRAEAMNAIQDYWDAFRAAQESGWADAESEIEEGAYDSMTALLGEDTAKAVTELINQYVTDNLGWEDWSLEDLPETLFTNLFPETGINVDAAASGMATETTVTGLATNLSASMSRQEEQNTANGRTMQNMEDFLRTIAGKDFTVNILPSAGFSQTSNRSARYLAKITGVSQT